MLMLHQALPDIAGEVCHALFVQAYYYRGKLVSDANALFLQLRDSGWHRVFIDGGIVFWQRVDGLDSPDQDRHHYTLTDLGTLHGYVGKRVVSVETADLLEGGELHVAFESAPTLVYRNVGGTSTLLNRLVRPQEQAGRRDFGNLGETGREHRRS
jgi:hypothetical protein